MDLHAQDKVPLIKELMKQERRTAARWPFFASAEMVDELETLFKTRVTELSLYGCYVDRLNALPKGTSVFIRIFTDTDSFEANARVVYVNANLGMGLSFQDVQSHHLPVLRKWLVGAGCKDI